MYIKDWSKNNVKENCKCKKTKVMSKSGRA